MTYCTCSYTYSVRFSLVWPFFFRFCFSVLLHFILFLHVCVPFHSFIMYFYSNYNLQYNVHYSALFLSRHQVHNFCLKVFPQPLRNALLPPLNLAQWKKFWFVHIPILHWLWSYRPKQLVGDIIAGLTIGVTHVPQGAAELGWVGLRWYHHPCG